MFEGQYTMEELEALLETYLDICDYRNIDTIQDVLIDFETSFSKLPENEQDAIFNHCILGINLEETAIELRTKPTTISSRCSRGKERLMRYMNGSYIGD